MKARKIILIMLIMLLVGITNVYAAGAKVIVEAEGKVKAGETKTVVVKIETEAETIGMMSGKIKAEGNVTIEKAGQEPGGDQPGGDQPAPTEKKLVGIEITKLPSKLHYKEGERFDKTGMVVIAKYDDDTSKEITNYTYSPAGKLGEDDEEITITYTEEGITKTDKIEITVKVSEEEKPEGQQPEKDDDGTVADKDIPDTGVEKVIIPAMIIIAIMGIVGYVGYRKNDI